MAIYISLNSFTDQGVRNIKDTTKRVDDFRKAGKKLGVTLKEVYWTMGSYDTVCIFEAPDDASMVALQASLGALGNVRTLTMRAFSEADMKGILGKLG